MMCEGPDDLSSRGNLMPERLIVEMTSVALLHRVKDVLHVHEDRNSIHGVKAGPITIAKDSA